MKREIIGYAVIEEYDDCYGYDENECYIGDTKESVLEIFEDVSSVEEIGIEEMKKDFGSSCGGYALEPKAYERFKRIAEREGIQYELKEEENRGNIYIIEMEYEDSEDDED